MRIRECIIGQRHRAVGKRGHQEYQSKIKIKVQLIKQGIDRLWGSVAMVAYIGKPKSKSLRASRSGNQNAEHNQSQAATLSATANQRTYFLCLPTFCM